MIFYDIETLNKIKATPFANCLYRLGKISGTYYRDITDLELEKFEKVFSVFKGTDSFNEKLDHVLQVKG